MRRREQTAIEARRHRSPAIRRPVRAPRGEQALGIGLPLTRQFIEAHGGKVELESKVGKGTSVILTIPRAPQ